MYSGRQCIKRGTFSVVSLIEDIMSEDGSDMGLLAPGMISFLEIQLCHRIARFLEYSRRKSGMFHRNKIVAVVQNKLGEAMDTSFKIVPSNPHKINCWFNNILI